MKFNQIVYVYPDVAFAVSFLMNGLILWGTARVTKLLIRWPRIFTGAFLGGVYSFAAAFPHLFVLHSFWMKILFSVLMFSACFMPLNIIPFAKALAVFYIISFLLGGCLIGILYFLKSTPYYIQLNDLSHVVAGYFVPSLIITIILFVVFTTFAGRFLNKRLSQNIFRVPLRVLFDRDEVEVEALIDTGNQLQDPLTRIPVIVVEYGALKHLFPVEIRNVFEQNSNPDLMNLLNSLSGSPWSRRFRIIPFTSLGKENGLLLGFRPDRIEVMKGEKHVTVKNVIVGIYHKELSPEGGYRALLHPDILEEGMTA